MAVEPTRTRQRRSRRCVCREGLGFAARAPCACAPWKSMKASTLQRRTMTRGLRALLAAPPTCDE
eukprot:6197229-Pleurochrysis_carterae.AAC.2